MKVPWNPQDWSTIVSLPRFQIRCGHPNQRTIESKRYNENNGCGTPPGNLNSKDVLKKLVTAGLLQNHNGVRLIPYACCDNDEIIREDVPAAVRAGKSSR